MQVGTITQDRLYPLYGHNTEFILNVTLPVGGPYGVAGGYAKGTVLGASGIAKRDEIRTIALTGTPTGAKVVITWTGQRTIVATTANLVTEIPTAAQMQTALETIFGVGNVSVVKSTLSYACTFANLLNECEIGGILTVAATFTAGTSPTVTHTRTQQGSTGAGQFGSYDDSTITVAKGVLVSPQYPDEGGGQTGETGPALQPTSAPMSVNGAYRCSDLVGLDANGVADMGRLLIGAAYTDTEAVIALNGGA